MHFKSPVSATLVTDF